MAASVTVNGRTVIHKKSKGTSTAFCDVCRTRRGAETIAIPYPSIGRTEDLFNGTKTVTADGEALGHEHSFFSKTLGGEAGNSGGIVSKTTSGKAAFVSFSMDVTIEGNSMVRDMDRMTHNDGNSPPTLLVQPPSDSECGQITMNIQNHTPYLVQSFQALTPNGVPQLVTAIKATYTFLPGDFNLRVSKSQIPFCLADEYSGEVGLSSLLYPSDMVPKKTGTDICVNGQVYAPMNRPVQRMQAGLKVGKISKVITVWGDRFWQYNMGLITPSKPVPFVRMPLSYERAFGGEDPFFEDGRNKQLCTYNPVGTGFRITRSKEALDGLKLPNLENPKRMIKRWLDKPSPAGFGSIAPSWDPRAYLSGTFDRIWQRERWPLLPLDFDAKFYNSAPPDLIARPFLKGKERVQLTNMHAEAEKIAFNLPGIRFKCIYSFGNRTYTRKPVLDTLTIEPDENRVILVYRCRYDGRAPIFRMKQVTVHED